LVAEPIHSPRPSHPCKERNRPAIQMEMLVGEQKQDGVALLLDPAERRSLISPFRSSRKCRMFVGAAVSGASRLNVSYLHPT
jgi:hypothetical protein